MLRRVLPAPALDLDGDQPAALVYRARGLAERRHLGGGGLFASDDHFLLWHSTRINSDLDQFELLPGFKLPKRFRVQPFENNSPVYNCDVEQSRMVLSGWRFIQRAVWGRATSDPEAGLPFAQPEVKARALDDPKRPRFELRRFVDGYVPSRVQGTSRIMRAEIHDLQTATDRAIGRVDWVDADHKGDVLWSQAGKLFRLAGPARRAMKIDAEPKLVADLNDMAFEAIEAPKRAMKWP